MNTDLRLLVVEDNPGDARLIREMLQGSHPHIALQLADSLRGAAGFLRGGVFDAVLLDLGLPDSRGLETLRTLQAQFASLPVVVMTGLGDEETGVQAVQLGAQDYLVKGEVESALLRRSVLYAIERKKTDEMLKEREQFLVRLSELNPAVISVADMATGRELYSSGPGMALLGFGSSDRRGLESFSRSLFFPGDFEKVAQALKRLRSVSGDERVDVEVRLKTDKAEWHWFQIINVVFKRDDGGTPVQRMSIVRDIHEHKRLEESLRESTRELEQANEDMEAFTYSVSHDLRAPLRHIHSFADLLNKDAAAVLDDRCKQHLDSICTGAEHMARLIEELLNLSRVGRQDLSRQVCSLNRLVQEVVTQLKPGMQDRKIELRIGELPFANCDPPLLKQVFWNLLANAIKFTRPRDLAIIEVGQTVVDGKPAVFVRDNGVGFSMKYADKLFGVFQRLHRREEFEGTGVGLSIVQRIVRRHGGHAWAEAQPNSGATFYFAIPFCAATESESLQASATSTV